VTGAVQDAAAIAAVAHDRGGLLVLDAAQTLGQRPLGVRSCGADVVCAPAHKWLLAPSGTAILWARAGVEPEPLLQGGTGTASESLDMPEALAERLEVGTGDVPALAGLAAAVEWLAGRGVEAVGERCRGLATACAARLGDLRGVRVFAAAAGAPIVSFTVAGHDPAEVAAMLEQAAGIEVRSGFHCAAAIHDHLGTRAGGTVRASFGPFNTAADVDAVVETVAAVTAA
jgi:selenocysteine lyase/cysteine desulfurase